MNCTRCSREWNKGELDSYLIEITAEIFAKKDEDGAPMVDKILDTAGQKGTGKWTGISSLELGVPVTLIGEAVYARCLSAMKDERVAASKILTGPKPTDSDGDARASSKMCARALYCSKMISYAQGYMLLREAAKEQSWNLNFGGIALMWRGGCIIRSRFPGEDQGSVRQESAAHQPAAGRFLQQDADRVSGVLAPRHRAGDRMRRSDTGVLHGARFLRWLSARERLPANLLQAQRDYFGAHTYERIDKPRGQFFHTNWTGRGGRVSSGTLQRLHS